MTPSADQDRGGGGGGEPLLAARAVTKRFGGLTALSEVSINVQVGEIVGLIDSGLQDVRRRYCKHNTRACE